MTLIQLSQFHQLKIIPKNKGENMTGIIIKNISNSYTVKTTSSSYTCTPCGKLRNQKKIPLVGDEVIFDEKNNYILDINKRKNELIRPPIANVDMAVIVTSVKQPDFDSYLLDKTITIISYNNIIPVIYFTKLDLLNEEEKNNINKIISYYQQIGYQTATNKAELINLINNKIVVLTGQSGAGKSTLLNKLMPNLNLKTQEISLALGRGKHTTRHTELYEIENAYIADTPGFSKIDFISMNNLDIRDNMKEMFDNLHLCKYSDCMHLSEDGCAITKLVKEGKILPSRYYNYKKFIERK